MPDLPDFENGFDAVKRSDRIMDALATGRRVPSNDPGDLAVASLLAHWRDDIRRGPVPELVSVRQAAAAMSRGQQPPGRSRFTLTVLGAVAAALLCLGGFGAVVYDAGPGDALYGLRTMLFGEAPVALTRDQQVALAAQSQLLEVQQLIQQGQWDQAQDKLAAASTAVQGVPDLDRKQALIDQMNQLTVKVEARDQNASLPPGAPPPPPLPGMVVPLPNVVEAPPVSSGSSTATTTTSTATTTTTPSPTTTTTTSAATPTTTSTATTTSLSPQAQTSAVQAPPPPPPPPPPTTTATTTAPATKTPTTTTTPPTTTSAAASPSSAANVPGSQLPAVAGPSQEPTPPPTSSKSNQGNPGRQSPEEQPKGSDGQNGPTKGSDGQNGPPKGPRVVTTTLAPVPGAG
jgi:Anti-sigma-D factor RsdA to sigma factor binding region